MSSDEVPNVKMNKYRCSGCGRERWFKTERCIVCGERMEKVKKRHGRHR